MFTGLVEDIGSIEQRETRGPGARLHIKSELGPLVLGESIAINGACLTVISFTASEGGSGGVFEVDCSAETLALTTLGKLATGSKVHLERALAAGARLGGHFVSGHVDGLCELIERAPVGESLRMVFRAPISLARYLADKGSVALDGVSLTVNRVARDTFEIMLIPHTLEKTLLGALSTGEKVNIETDILARYVARLVSFDKEAPPTSSTPA